MKSRLLPTLCFALALSPALAQPATIAIDDALRIARAAGIATITKAELDDGKWEIDGRNGAGVKMEIDIDAATGRIVQQETQ